MAADEEAMARKFAALWPYLDERQRRLWLGVEAATRGDPESPLRWTSKSTRQLADALAAQDHEVSHCAVPLSDGQAND